LYGGYVVFWPVFDSSEQRSFFRQALPVTELFARAQAAKEDTLALTMAQLLCKDYKAGEAGGHAFGIAAVAGDLAAVGRRYAARNDPFEATAASLCARQRLGLFVVMTITTEPVLTRQLALFGPLAGAVAAALRDPLGVPRGVKKKKAKQKSTVWLTSNFCRTDTRTRLAHGPQYAVFPSGIYCSR
jgi:hypothetical protein